MRREDIVEQAACGEADPSLFDNDNSRNPAKISRREMEAKEYCSYCPVRLECLEDQVRFEASTSDDIFGIFGGLNPSERLPLVLRARTAKQPGVAA